MTKKEFMNQKEVPQFIKDLVSSFPDDIGVDFAKMTTGNFAEAGSHGELDRGEVYKDGVCLAPILDNLLSGISDIVELTDYEGNVKREDLDHVKAIAYALQGSASALLIAASGGVLK